MPAIITVSSGLTSGTQYTVEKKVVRIGGGSHCDICLPATDIPQNAATVAFQQGQYALYNRSRRAMTLGRAILNPGESALWENGQILKLSPQVSLTLEIIGESNLVLEVGEGLPAEDIADLDQFEATLGVDSARGKKTSLYKSLPVIAVTCVALLATVMFLVGGLNSSVQKSDFDKIVAFAAQTDGVSQNLMQDLRFAEAAVTRDDTQMAAEMLGRISRSLSAVENQEASSDKQRLKLAILYHVRNRLRTLAATH